MLAAVLLLSLLCVHLSAALTGNESQQRLQSTLHGEGTSAPAAANFCAGADEAAEPGGWTTFPSAPGIPGHFVDATLLQALASAVQRTAWQPCSRDGMTVLLEGCQQVRTSLARASLKGRQGGMSGVCRTTGAGSNLHKWRSACACRHSSLRSLSTHTHHTHHPPCLAGCRRCRREGQTTSCAPPCPATLTTSTWPPSPPTCTGPPATSRRQARWLAMAWRLARSACPLGWVQGGAAAAGNTRKLAALAGSWRTCAWASVEPHSGEPTLLACCRLRC